MIILLLVVHIMVAIALVAVILLQKSEGGALGMGGGGMSGFMTGRSTANLLTRATAILAAAVSPAAQIQPRFARMPRPMRLQSHQRQRKHSLPGARLSYNPQRFAFPQRERHIIHRPHPSARRRQLHRQSAHFKACRHGNMIAVRACRGEKLRYHFIWLHRPVPSAMAPPGLVEINPIAPVAAGIATPPSPMSAARCFFCRSASS